MNVKNFLFAALTVTNQAAYSHYSLEKLLLEDTSTSFDKKYYALLPETKDEDADICFIRSRDPENMSLEQSFLKMIAHASNAQIIVETGTYLGDTTAKMARYFKEVHTIELGVELYEKAKTRFNNKKNISLYQGDSAQILPSLVNQLTSKAVFFLDAHYSMFDTACGPENTPIIAELEIIKKAKLKDSIIIIDDLRMFYQAPYTAKDTFAAGYPTAQELVEKILEINSSYQIAIVYDTLIAFPQSCNITVSPLVKAITISRLYGGTNYLVDDVLIAELCISRANGKEKETLIDLGQRWLEPWSYGTLISQHYALWCGLIFMGTEEYSKAYAYFADAKRRGLFDWRLDWYMVMAQANCFFDVR